jgi:hypothetical protein
MRGLRVFSRIGFPRWKALLTERLARRNGRVAPRRPGPAEPETP